MTTASSATDLAIDLKHVAKTYRGRVHALRGIEMRVARGEIFGLLGPNGAGKSTLVKILMTVIRASKCQGTMLGRPVGSKPALASVGYLPEHHKFPDYLRGAQVLDFYGAMSGVTRRERRKRAPQLLELVDMSKWAKHRVKGYSKGMRQRLGIAQALMNKPDLVLLDEPTDGVDPVGRRDIREILTRLKGEGHTIFLNSHLLSELEMVCDRVAILVQGTVRQQGTIAELTEHRRRYEIETLGDSNLREALAPVLQSTPGQSASTEDWANAGASTVGDAVAIAGTTISVRTADATRIQPVLDQLRSSGIVIEACRPIRPSLEDLFMEAVIDPNTGDTLEPGAGTGGTR